MMCSKRFFENVMNSDSHSVRYGYRENDRIEGECINYIAGLIMRDIFLENSFANRFHYLSFIRNVDHRVSESNQPILGVMEKFHMRDRRVIQHMMRSYIRNVEGEMLFYAFPFWTEYHFKHPAVQSYRIIRFEK